MYATVTRRKQNPAAGDAARQRAREEYFPKLRQAPGFVAFYIVQGEDGDNYAISVWASRAAAEAFQAQGQTWAQTLEGLGLTQQSRTTGEVVEHFTAQQ